MPGRRRRRRRPISPRTRRTSLPACTPSSAKGQRHSSQRKNHPIFLPDPVGRSIQNLEFVRESGRSIQNESRANGMDLYDCFKAGNLTSALWVQMDSDCREDPREDGGGDREVLDGEVLVVERLRPRHRRRRCRPTPSPSGTCRAWHGFSRGRQREFRVKLCFPRLFLMWEGECRVKICSCCGIKASKSRINWLKILGNAIREMGLVNLPFRIHIFGVFQPREMHTQPSSYMSE